MPSKSLEERMLRRNKKRFLAEGSPPLKPVKASKLALGGINKNVRMELRRHRKKWVDWTRSSGGGNAPTIRVAADRLMSDVPGAKRTFVGIGLDEHVATRLLKQKGRWKTISRRQAKEVFSSRSRTADLVWATTGGAEPIAGHTPAVKHQPIAGTKAAITAEHGTRDRLRASAIDATFKDLSSPSVVNDALIMSQLATIKYMASPSTELESKRGQVQALTTPRYTALTGKADIRHPTNFTSMVEHVQEERERKKWEVGAQMMTDPRLQPLVPPVISDYLRAKGNVPSAARALFRSDVNTDGRQRPINTALTSDTHDLTAHSLHQFSTMVTPTTRPRALSDARLLPPVIPINARGP